MIIKQNKTSFPAPLMLVLGSRAPGTSEGYRVAALIAKQASAGTAQILLTDVGYNPGALEPVKIEADVVAYKPLLDVVVVRNMVDEHAVFGNITITRNGSPGTPRQLTYGWRIRGEEPRLGQAGNAGGFTPESTKPWKLPNGFQDRFLNGSPLLDQPAPLWQDLPLQAGDTISFEGVVATVPAAPKLVFKLGEKTIPEPSWVSRGVDTVVYLQAEGRFLLTWRFVFVWEPRLELATLEVS